MTLTTRIEQAVKGEQRELLTEAFFALHPSPRFDPDWHCVGNAFSVWQTKEIKFKRMLDAEAYLSAAEMLVADDCHYLIDSHHSIARVARYWDDPNHGPQCEVVEAEASTPALALLSAILRSGESG